MTMNWKRTMIGLALCLLLPNPALANQTDQPVTIRVFVDLRLDKPTINGVMDSLLRTALKHRFDVRVRTFDTAANEEWSPPKNLDLSDFRPSMAGIVFQGGEDQERESEGSKRLEAALLSFDSYAKRVSGTPHPCSRLTNVAKEIASESFMVTLLVVGDPICSSPQVRLRLPRDRNLVALLPSVTGQDEGGKRECAALAREREIENSFPHARIIPMVASDTLAEVLLKGSPEPVSPAVEIRGCNLSAVPQRERTNARLNRKLPPVLQNESNSSDSELRIVAPKHHAHVARVVPFQGDGAHPGETLLPVIRVGDEYWPQAFVRSREDGSYGGEVIVGRPFNDCGVSVELRLFGSLQQPVSVGRPLGSWPLALEASLPVRLTRTEECGSGG
jgi:hypothetical protein